MEIFQENIKAIRCTTTPENAPEAKSSKTTQVRRNAIMDGTVIIMAIIVPFNTISCIVRLEDFVLSDNS